LYLDDKHRWTGEMPGDLRLVFHRIGRRGVNAYVVGPAVRDALMTGTMDRVQRVDILLDGGSLNEVERALGGAVASKLFISQPEKVRKGLSTFTVQGSESGEVIRKVVVSSTGTQGLKDELARREVTINAVAMDPSGAVQDPFGGVKDLAEQKVRTIQPPNVAFTSRPLNLVKVAKHLAYHGFDVDEETEEAAVRLASNILDVTPDRIRPEFERLLVNLYPDRGLNFLQRTGVLKYVLPEVQALVGFEDSCEVHHKDIWEHTKKVVCQSKPTVAIRWATLLHDIGKVWTRTVAEDGRVHFFRHEDLGAVLFSGIAARLGLEPRLTERVGFLVRNHSRVNMYTRDWTDSAVRRLMREMGDNLDDLLALSRADITSKQERRVEELTRLLDELEKRIQAIREADARQPVLAKGTGEAIMAHFGIPPSPLVGTLKNALEDAVEDGRLPPGRPPEEYMAFLEDYVRSHGQDL